MRSLFYLIATVPAASGSEISFLYRRQNTLYNPKLETCTILRNVHSERTTWVVSPTQGSRPADKILESKKFHDQSSTGSLGYYLSIS